MTAQKLPPGAPWIIFGVFMFFAAGLWSIAAWIDQSTWRELHENGVKVRGTVSEKHVLKTEPPNSPASYYRVFFLPGPDLTPEQTKLWAQTSTAWRYPNSVSLFDDWGNRLWDDLEKDEWMKVQVGDEFVLRINGERSMINRPEGPSTAIWFVPGIAFAIGVLACGMFVRRRRRERRLDMEAPRSER